MKTTESGLIFVIGTNLLQFPVSLYALLIFKMIFDFFSTFALKFYSSQPAQFDLKMLVRNNIRGDFRSQQEFFFARKSFWKGS